MKIVHLCLANYFVDNYAYQENMLAKYHILQGHDVTVVASLRTYQEGVVHYLTDPDNYISREGYRVRRIDYKGPLPTFNGFFPRYRDLIPALEDEAPDVLFMHGSQFMDIAKVGRYIDRHPGVKAYVDNHADLYNSGKKWLSLHILHKIIWRHYARLIEPRVERFFGVTPVRCRFLEQYYKIPAQKIDLLLLGVDDEALKYHKRSEIRKKIRSDLGISPDDFVLVAGGRIEERKKFHLLMQAVVEMDRPNMKLILFGNRNSDMEPLLQHYSQSDSIHYLGWIEAEKAYEYFLASDLAVFPGSHSVYSEQATGS